MHEESEEEGNLCFQHQTDMLLLTIVHNFFPHVSSFGYHPSCQQQCHMGFAWQTKLVIPGKTGKKFCAIQS